MVATGARMIALALAFWRLPIFVPTLTVGVGPRLTQLWMSERLAALVAKDPIPAIRRRRWPASKSPAWSSRWAPTSISPTARAPPSRAPNLGGLALVDDFQRPAFLAQLAELQSDAVPLNDISGLQLFARQDGACHDLPDAQADLDRDRRACDDKHLHRPVNRALLLTTPLTA